MASRGQLGGVSDAAPKAVIILDAVGFPYIVLETVGVGQAEVDIVESAHRLENEPDPLDRTRLEAGSL